MILRASSRAPSASATLRAIRLLRFATTSILVVVSLCCALLLAVRFVQLILLPHSKAKSQSLDRTKFFVFWD